MARGQGSFELADATAAGLTDVLELVAMSGSLRAGSRNTALLHAAALAAPASIRVTVYAGLGDLPLFNPDLEVKRPRPVLELKRAVGAAQGLVLACPEYAHGVSGVLKNALDWLVSGEEFVHKPIALWNTSPRAAHAQASLAETVATMSGRIVTRACVAVPLLGTALTPAQIAADDGMRKTIIDALLAFVAAIHDWPRSGG